MFRKHHRTSRPLPSFSTPSEGDFAAVETARNGACGFSLIELLVVIAVMTILVGLSIPAIRSMGGASRFDGSVLQVSGLLDEARSYAMAQNTYVWLAFYPVDAPDKSGEELYVVTLASSDGSNPFTGWDGTYAIPYTMSDSNTTVQSVLKIATFKQLHLIAETDKYFTSPTQISTVPSTTPTAPASQLVFTLTAPGTGITLGEQQLPANADAPACAVIAFSPIGTVLTGANLAATIGLDFEPVKGQGILDTTNIAALRISGLTGTVITYRK